MFDRSIPVIGFHTLVATREGIDSLIRLIEEALAPKGFNTLIAEMRFQFRCFPEYSSGTIAYEDASRLADVCEKHGIRLVPLLPCLGHQSDSPWGTPLPLLKLHPEFVENPVAPDATWPEIYHHSWCASYDDIYQYIFPMMDEIAEATRAAAFHVGLDEVFDIAMCPRCKGKDPAELFARTVKILHDHLTEKGLEMMMWGDRLLNSKAMGYQMWEADRFGMYPALHMDDKVTRDIIICDWHYDLHSAGYPSVETFIQEGFFVLPSVFHIAENAEHFWTAALEAQYLTRRYGWPGRLGGVLFTNWAPLDDPYVDNLLKAMKGEEAGDGLDAMVGKVIRKLEPRVAKFRL